MKKAIIPASFLSAVTKNNNSVLESENFMYVIREESTFNQASKLYSLFFGSPIKRPAEITENQTLAEPDYYSSYE